MCGRFHKETSVDVDPEPVVAIARPYFPDFVEAVQKAFKDFDTWIPGTDRVTVEDTRPKLMHCRIMHLLEKTFGRAGSPRVEEHSRLSYLVIEAENALLGIRFKKFDGGGRSLNHQSEQQDTLRETGLFPWIRAYHLFVGYRVKPGLVPSLLSISMTFENKQGVVWRHMIWTDEDGMNPVQEVFPPLLPPPTELPPETKVRPKKGRRGRVAEGGHDDVG